MSVIRLLSFLISGYAVQALHFLGVQHHIDIQQDFYFVFDFSHAQYVGQLDAVAEIGRVFNVGGLQGENLRHAVHNDADLEFAGGAVDLHDDNASALRVLELGQVELQP